MDIVKLYRKEVISLAIPISMSGIVGYINNIISVLLAGRHSIELVASITLGTLMISTLISPLMSLIPGNQSLMIKLDDYPKTKKSTLILIALFKSILLGIVCFILSKKWFQFTSNWLIDFSSDYIKHLTFHYVKTAKYSILLMPIIFSITGIMNGLKLPQLVLRITLLGSLLKFLLLLFFSIFYRKGVTEEWLTTLAITNVFSEIAMLGYSFWLISQQHLLFDKPVTLSSIFLSLVFYLKKIKNFLSYTSLQNLLGVCGELIFSGLLINCNVAILAIYRLSSQVFTFNRIIFNGLHQANALIIGRLFFCSKKSSEIDKIKKYIILTLILSSFFSILLIIMTNFFIKIFIGSHMFIISSIINISFAIEGISLLFFHILIHCGSEKKVGLTSSFLSVIFLITIIFIGRIQSQAVVLAFFLYKLCNLIVNTYFIFGRKIHKEL